MSDIESYNYELPKHLIAQSPAKKRDESRLMLINKNDTQIEHATFKQLPDYLQPNDILVLNDTKVLKARLIGKRQSGGQVEILLHHPTSKDNQWVAMLKPAKRLKEKEMIQISDTLSCEIIQKHYSEFEHIVDLHSDNPIDEEIENTGQMPLPPYIEPDQTNTSQINERYQTVFSENLGAVAAPTAGLHFTEPLLEALTKQGITILKTTLHVGLGTFQPIKTDQYTNHVMHEEAYEIKPDVADYLTKAKAEKRRIIAVGTTVVRTLESAFNNGKFDTGKRKTDIFIYPGYSFKAIDGLITNFHLPKSSLLLLVSALAGKKNIEFAYINAIKNGYRFYSFGDAMFIQP